MAIKVSISPYEDDQERPSMAFLEILIIIKSIGNITGKPNTAISVWLLFAFEAMAEIMVKAKEKLMAANIRLIVNKP